MQFRKTLTPAVLYANPTLEALAAYIDKNDTIESPLIALNPYGSQPPLIGVPGSHGNAMVFRNLVSRLGADYPVYALQFPRYDQRQPKFRSMQHLAQSYLQEIRRQIPDQPFYLIGESLGGVVALEMAQQLSAAGTPALGLILLDSPINTGDDWREDMEDAAEQTANEVQPVSGIRFQLYRLKRFISKNLTTDLQRRTALRVKREQIGLTRRYQMQPYGSSIFYLSCREDRGAATSKREKAWQQLAAGGFEVLDVSGIHQMILSEPAVLEVSRHVRRIMQETKRTE